jgi:hypothetical protein
MREIGRLLADHEHVVGRRMVGGRFSTEKSDSRHEDADRKLPSSLHPEPPGFLEILPDYWRGRRRLCYYRASRARYHHPKASIARAITAT